MLAIAGGIILAIVALHVLFWLLLGFGYGAAFTGLGLMSLLRAIVNTKPTKQITAFFKNKIVRDYWRLFIFITPVVVFAISKNI